MDDPLRPAREVRRLRPREPSAGVGRRSVGQDAAKPSAPSPAPIAEATHLRLIGNRSAKSSRMAERPLTTGRSSIDEHEFVAPSAAPGRAAPRARAGGSGSVEVGAASQSAVSGIVPADERSGGSWATRETGRCSGRRGYRRRSRSCRRPRRRSVGTLNSASRVVDLGRLEHAVTAGDHPGADAVPGGRPRGPASNRSATTPPPAPSSGGRRHAPGRCPGARPRR